MVITIQPKLSLLPMCVGWPTTANYAPFVNAAALERSRWCGGRYAWAPSKMFPYQLTGAPGRRLLREGRAAGWWRLHEIEIVARLKENVMLIYLVRWPDLSASFVQAESEEHLLDVLDQVGNPDDCQWSI